MSFGFGFGFPSWRTLAGGFSPAALFVGGQQGFFYDPSDLNTLFQDSAGTTPVTGVEQVVGLMLDKSKGLVLGAELVTNGDFSSGTTGWTGVAVGGGTAVLAVVSGELSLSNGSTNDGVRATQSITTVIGRWYKATCLARRGSSAASAILRATNDSQGSPPSLSENSTTSLSNVQLTITFLATATTTYITLGAASGGVSPPISYFNNISVRELPGNHATSTGAARPTLSARVNLLTYSEDFTNASGWSQSGVLRTANTETAPNGTLTADTLTGNSTSNIVIWSPTSGFSSPAASYTASISIKAGTADFAVISLWGGSATNGVNLWVDVQNGTVSSNSVTAGYAFTSGTVTPEGNGWLRVVLTGSVPTSTVYFSVRLVDADGGFSYTNSNGKTLYVWGADLRVANDGVGIPAYQRVNTATDYDSSGFPLYLRFGGTQAMSTGSIDFTATDKMSVFAGVRKLSDAARGIVVELSATFSNPGVFQLNAPIVSSAADYGFASGGSVGSVSSANYTNAAVAAPVTNVVSGIAEIATDTNLLRVNSAQVATSTTDQGTGNYGNYPLYIGARAGTSLFFNGRIYSLIGVGSAVSAGNISATESWVNGRTKAY